MVLMNSRTRNSQIKTIETDWPATHVTLLFRSGACTCTGRPWQSSADQRHELLVGAHLTSATTFEYIPHASVVSIVRERSPRE